MIQPVYKKKGKLQGLLLLLNPGTFCGILNLAEQRTLCGNLSAGTFCNIYPGGGHPAYTEQQGIGADHGSMQNQTRIEGKAG